MSYREIEFNLGKPERMTMDLSGSNIAVSNSINNKQKFKRTLGFKSFKTAEITLYGIEVVYALRKEFYKTRDNYAQMIFQEFCSLVA